MGRAPCCDKANVKKGPWSPEEDAKLKSYIDQNGTGGNWIALPQKIGLKRCGKSCRLRWLNYLRPNIKHGGFSEEEDNIICSLYISIGSRWSIIAAQLPGRTDNDIKNYWNTRLKKKLLGKQRKETKQTGKAKNKNSNNTFSDSLIFQSPPPVLPPIPYSNEDPRSNDNDSIRKLLIKLGGKFSNDHHRIHEEQLKLQYPTTDEPALYNNSIGNNNLIPNYSPQIPLLNAPHFDMSTMLQEPLSVNLASEMYENQQKVQGVEFFYDDIAINCSNGVSCGEIMDWGAMNPLIFASNNNEGILQGSVIEEFGIDKIMRRGNSCDVGMSRFG